MRRLASVLAVCAAMSAPLVAQSERFDVVSVKENTANGIRVEPHPPDGYRQLNFPLFNYVSYAFGISQWSRLGGLPEWTRTTRYDIIGKASHPITEAERRAMIRDVLVTRFNLKTHMETREQTVYVLTAVREDHRLGPGLTPRPDCATKTCEVGGSGRADGVALRAMTLPRFASGMLSNLLGQVVQDETGLDGTFDIEASWRPFTASDPNDERPSIFTALQEQLGLKLEPEKRPVEVLVVDQIERPTPD